MSDNQCQICFAGTTRREVKEETYSFKGYETVIQQPGLWCDSCGEGILNGDDLKATAEEIDNFKQEVKLKIAKDLKEKREKLHITQKQAAEICGGGVNAFHKYEKGEVLPPKATINLLTILANHPDLMKEISSR